VANDIHEGDRHRAPSFGGWVLKAPFGCRSHGHHSSEPHLVAGPT
jgi:hypothetical protein